jgi:hypothetical protein
VRARRLVLVIIALVAVIVLLRRRRTPEYVDVHFDDGATVRLTTGREAEELLDDAYAALDSLA